MDSDRRKILWFGVSTAIIVGLIYFADVDRFVEALSKANLFLLLPAFVAGLGVFPVWGFTWYRVFRKTGIELSYRKSLRIFMAGQFMNSVTPLGQFGGEPVMAYLVSENSDASYEKGLTSVFSSDVINGVPEFTFLTGGIIYMVFFRSLNEIIVEAAYMVLLATLVGGTFVYLLWFESGRIESAVLKVLRKITSVIYRGKNLVSRLEERLERMQKAFEAVGSDPRYLLETAVAAHFYYIFHVICFYFIMVSLGFDPNIAPIYFVVTLSGLANFAPTPGGSGAYEAVMASLVTVFFPQISFAVGLIIGILFRMTTYWPGIFLGYLALNSLENGGGDGN